MRLRVESVSKPLSAECYHFYDEDDCYVGAVWRQEWQEAGDGWHAYCMLSNHGVVDGAPFKTREEAEAAMRTAGGI